MTNNKNLIPFNKRTKNDQREIAKKGVATQYQSGDEAARINGKLGV